MGQDVFVNGSWWPVSEKVSDLSTFIFFEILHGYVSKTYPISIDIRYVSKYPIRYGLKYPCFIQLALVRQALETDLVERLHELFGQPVLQSRARDEKTEHVTEGEHRTYI
jgi:hypothetical protein